MQKWVQVVWKSEDMKDISNRRETVKETPNPVCYAAIGYIYNSIHKF